MYTCLCSHKYKELPVTRSTEEENGSWEEEGGRRVGRGGGMTGINTEYFVRGETGMGVVRTC